MAKVNSAVLPITTNPGPDDLMGINQLLIFSPCSTAGDQPYFCLYFISTTELFTVNSIVWKSSDWQTYHVERETRISKDSSSKEYIWAKCFKNEDSVHGSASAAVVLVSLTHPLRQSSPPLGVNWLKDMFRDIFRKLCPSSFFFFLWKLHFYW